MGGRRTHCDADGRQAEALSLSADAVAWAFAPAARCSPARAKTRRAEPSLMSFGTCHVVMKMARGQEAKLPELYPSISLARLWRDQGRIREARRMLDETYDWFTEGFDIADLQEARALLDAPA